MSERDIHFMRIALEEASKGIGFTSPNPAVGAVIVKDGEALSRGYHAYRGAPHAEAAAISQLNKSQLKDSTIYVTLEPCCHQGLTPPCTELIIKSGIRRVVVAALDVDHRVRGKSRSILLNAGIKVDYGILADEAEKLNTFYYFAKMNRRPYIIIKSALTLDGKIKDFIGNSKWITSSRARSDSHRLRALVNSIAVGGNTFRTDKPILNCRLPGYLDKKINKIIFSDTITQSEAESHFAAAASNGKVFVIGSRMSADPQSLMTYLYESGVDSVMVEGGSQIIAYFMRNNLADRIFLYYRCGFLGGEGNGVYGGDPFLLENLKSYKFRSADRLSDDEFVAELYRGANICLPGLYL